MTFVHEDPEFDDLLRIVAAKHDLHIALVEKDYWVTHALWALHDQGFDVWFKGGTSLSKGFCLIQRFSEDLDLKLDPGRVEDLPLVVDWWRESKRATTARRAYFERLAHVLAVPGASVELDAEEADRSWRTAQLRVHYDGRNQADLDPAMKPYVLLEIGSARVLPFVRCDLSSFVHDEPALWEQGESYTDNRPRGVRCVHPLVTLIEKLDALIRKAARDDPEPSTFARHYEDAARIIEATDGLPPLEGYGAVRELVDEMVAQKQIRAVPRSDDGAFAPATHAAASRIRAAHEAITGMYWGPRMTLDEACLRIRDWIDSALA